MEQYGNHLISSHPANLFYTVPDIDFHLNLHFRELPSSFWKTIPCLSRLSLISIHTHTSIGSPFGVRNTTEAYLDIVVAKHLDIVIAKQLDIVIAKQLDIVVAKQND